MIRIHFDNRLKTDVDASFEQMHKCIEDLGKKVKDCTGTNLIIINTLKGKYIINFDKITYIEEVKEDE